MDKKPQQNTINHELYVANPMPVHVYAHFVIFVIKIQDNDKIILSFVGLIDEHLHEYTL